MARETGRRLIPSRRRSGGRRPRSPLARLALWSAGGLLALLLVLGLLAAWRLTSIYRDLVRARDLLDQAGGQLDNGELAEARDALGEAASLLVSANGDLHTAPELDLLGWVPVIRQNLDSLRSSVGVTLRLADGGRLLLDTAEPLQADDGNLEVPLRSGSIPLSVVADVAAEAKDLAADIPVHGDRPNSTLLLRPIADLQDRVYEEGTRRRSQLDSVTRALTLLSDMSGANGPRRYLIAVANSAAMRGTGGMILSYGILEGEGGDFRLGAFGNIDELLLPEGQGVDPEAVGVPADTVRRWAPAQMTELWRAANLTADFTVAARIMEAMFTQVTGLPVDGVIQIDSAGLSAIMRGTGPVTVAEVGTVTADNVVAFTLNEAYVQFPDRAVRQDLLGDVAEEVFRVLVDGQYPSLRPLGEALFTAGAEHHILLHTVHSDAQRQAAHFGVSGALPAPESDYALLTVQNFGLNKLDYYIDTSVELRGERPPGEFGTLTASVTVTNTAPADGEPPYVFGPTPADEYGVYRGFASLYLPIGTSITSATGDGLLQQPAVTAEAGRTLVAFAAEIPAGESRTVVLELRLPPRPRGRYGFTIVPVARVLPTVYRIDIDAGGGGLLDFDGPVTTTVDLTVP